VKTMTEGNRQELFAKGASNDQVLTTSKPGKNLPSMVNIKNMEEPCTPEERCCRDLEKKTYKRPEMVAKENVQEPGVKGVEPSLQHKKVDRGNASTLLAKRKGRGRGKDMAQEEEEEPELKLKRKHQRKRRRRRHG